MNKILTIIYPLYKPTKIEIENMVFNIKKLIKDFDFLILVDNPLITQEIKSILPNIGEKTYFSEKNVGKFQLIKNASNLIETKYYKICDPDDLLSHEYLLKFNKILKTKKKDYSLIRLMPSKYIKPGNYRQKDIEKIEGEINKRFMKSLVNENTILSSKSLKSFELEALNQTKSSDVLLSLSEFVNGKPKIYNYHGGSFYIYNFHKGISNENGKNKDLNNINQLITFLEIMVLYKKNNKMKSPSFYDYRWAHNLLVDINIQIKDKIKYAIKIYDLLSICAKDNLNWKIKWNEKNKQKFIFDKLANGVKI